MSGRKDFNYPAFFAAESRLKELGHEPLNPARLFPGEPPGSRPYADYFRGSLELLLQADAIYRLPEWKLSVGSTCENRVAHLLGLHVILEDEIGRVQGDGSVSEPAGGGS
jgi:hypothetical protein